MRTNLRTLFPVLPVILSLALVGCASSSTPSATVIRGGTIVLSKPSDVLNLDPHPSFNGNDWQIMSLVYDTVTTIDKNLKVAPNLASSWDQPDQLTYVFHLRTDVKFSNGRPLVADDVVGSIQRILDPKTGAFWADQIGPIQSVSATDDHTVTVKLKSPYTPFLVSLAHVSAAILPMAELRAGTFDPKKTFLGSGPFVATAHVQDQSWTFEPNKFYWKHGLPLVSKLMFQIIPDDSARIAALRDGRVQLAFFDNPDAPNLLRGVTGVKVVVQKTTDYYRVDLNAKNPASKAYRLPVRQAFNYAIDRSQILAIALAGVGEITGAVSPTYSSACPPLKRDVSKAKSILQQAGISNVQLELIASPSFSTFPPIAQVIQQNLADVGIKATINQLDVGEWEKRVFVDDPGQFDTGMSYNAGYGDPSNILQFFEPQYAGFANYTNSYNLEDNALADVISKVNSTPNGPARDALIRQACSLIDADSNIIPLVTRPVVLAYRSDLMRGEIQPSEPFVDPFRYASEYQSLKQ